MKAVEYLTNTDVSLTVCFTLDDERTRSVVEWGQSHFPITAITLEPSHLFRRAIGRHIAANSTKADMVWFTYVDYLFTRDSLVTSYNKYVGSIAPLIFPKVVWTSHTHKEGDKYTEEQFGQDEPLEIDEDLFYAREMKKAIGGIQIVNGKWCREHGYLDGTKWVQPVESNHFVSCKCDVPFRKGMDSVRHDIAGVYRVRHSKAGRDKGTKDHGK